MWNSSPQPQPPPNSDSTLLAAAYRSSITVTRNQLRIQGKCKTVHLTSTPTGQTLTARHPSKDACICTQPEAFAARGIFGRDIYDLTPDHMPKNRIAETGLLAASFSEVFVRVTSCCWCMCSLEIIKHALIINISRPQTELHYLPTTNGIEDTRTPN